MRTNGVKDRGFGPDNTACQQETGNMHSIGAPKGKTSVGDDDAIHLIKERKS